MRLLPPHDHDAVLGRARERHRIDRLLADARQGTSGALAVFGDPGIGKSALVGYALQRAVAGGTGVLAARGVPLETHVAFGGLLELLRPALDELHRLPRAQAAALQGALDRGPSSDADRYVVGAATLNLLCAYSERGPLLVLVDDAQWFDEPSLAALVFAARRLLGEAVAVMLTARTGEAPALEAGRLQRLEVGAVDCATAAAILVSNGAPTPPPGVASRLVRATGGNPLALVELAGRCGELDLPAGGGPLAIATSAQTAYRRRLDDLPDATRTVLALAAAEDSGQFATIAAAAETAGLELDDLSAAERAGIVRLDGALLAFEHPLARSAAYLAVAPDCRRVLHAALAEVLTLPTQLDRRAWHLAAAALGPDDAVAAALDDTARRARKRAAHAAAAGAAVRAAELSSSHDTRARRLFAAGEAAWLSGNAARALRVLREALALSPERWLRAEIEHLRGQVTIRCGDVMAGHEILVDGASRVASHDPGKAVVMLAEAAGACVYAGRPKRMLSVSRRAWNLLSPDAGARERFFAGLALGTALVHNGEGAAGALEIRHAAGILENSDALADDLRRLPATTLGPLWLSDSHACAELIDRTIESVRACGALGTLPLALALAARDAATSDRWRQAAVLYEEAADLARETAQEMPLCAALGGLAGLEARQGRERSCRAHAREAVTLAKLRGLPYLELWALDALAELELGLGRPREAKAPLERKLGILEQLAITDPDVSPVPELVEAAVRAGVPDPVADARATFARRALHKGQPWALARVERSLGLLAGEDELDQHFARALELHVRTRDRFETARTHLCYGERLRRTGRRVRAREELRRALEIFDALGAAPWAARTRAELQASGEAARRRDPSTLDDLTPQELRVGTLLASGATTREVAAELFLSPKTVEYHQRNAYRKLGIHSREELATRLGVTRSRPAGH